MNAPEPQRNEIDIHMFQNGDHAGDKSFLLVKSGFFMNLNTALVLWFSKRQSTVKTSVFSIEFVP